MLLGLAQVITIYKTIRWLRELCFSFHIYIVDTRFNVYVIFRTQTQASFSVHGLSE